MNSPNYNGIYYDMTHDEYHSYKDIVSNSYLGRLDQVPANAVVIKEESDAFFVGKALHVLLLDGREAFDRQYAVGEDRGHQKKVDKEYWEDFAEENEGKVILTPDDEEDLKGMRESVLRNPNAKKFLTQFQNEVSIFWTDERTGIKCKARPDGIEAPRAPNILFELKSGRSADYRTFSRDLEKYGYAREAAIFAEGYCEHSGIDFDDIMFPFIIVEKTIPYRCEVYELDNEYLWWGREEFHRLLDVELECRDRGFYPSHKHRTIQRIMKPRYLRGGF
jgi:hypothetical protein